ncbi:MAG: acetyl/propionyl-CoA carboxylase subunit alpha, partial [Sphingomicrobium sp.]
MEFVAGQDRKFFFLEMNTRLQVEHPVTEEVIGIDLVEQMIRVAAGEKLAFGQKDVKLNGWSVETRVYAEDPYRHFLPSTGRLTKYRHPRESGDPAKPRKLGSRLRGNDEVRVRIDDGVAEGGEVSMFYDPMIAKLITWAPTRDAAIDAQVAALDQFVVDGINDNMEFLSALMQHPRFREGNLATDFIADEYPDGFAGAPADKQLLSDLALIAAKVQAISDEAAAENSDQLGGHIKLPSHRVVRIAGEDHRVRIRPYKGGTVAIIDRGHIVYLEGDWRPGQNLLRVNVDGRARIVQVRRAGRDWELQTRGAKHRVKVMSPHVANLARHMIDKPPPDLSRFLIAPMPGLLTRLDVKAGDT